MPRVDGTNRGVLITEESARRIGRAVQKLEQGNRNVPGRKMRTAFDEGGGEILIAKTTEEWAKDTTAQVEIIFPSNCNEEGSGGQTVEAHNLWYDVAAGVKVAIAQAANGCWYMVEASNDRDDGSDSSGDDGSDSSGDDGECGVMSLGGQNLKTLDGYSPDKTQVIGHREGCLQWIDTTECADTSS
jgi:hypothetical protein